MDPSRAVMTESRGVAVFNIVQTINTGEKEEKCRPWFLPEKNNNYYLYGAKIHTNMI